MQSQSKPKRKTHQPLTIASRAVSTLIPDPRNARQHSQKQIGQVARSVSTFGFLVPVLIDKQCRIIAGHGRVEAAKSLGMAEVPTIQISHLSEAQRRAFMIADNRLTENSTWDQALLGQELKFLSESDLDFGVEVTGFEMAEIDLMIEGLDEEPEADEADALPAVQSEAVSKAEDIWLLGKHKLLCGDALIAAHLELLMDGRRANAVFTDPPYNVPISGFATGNGKTRHRNFAMASGEMSKAQFTSFLTAALKLAAHHSAAGSLQFVCMDWRHMGELLEAGDAAYTELKNVCVWCKTNAGMGSLYRSQHEMIFVFKSGKAAHRNNIQLGKHGRYRTNIWTYPGANSFNSAGKGEKPLEGHPTPKPAALVADAILDCSARGDLVLDTFIGSGTTILAAERTGRVCNGLELDPLYVDVAIRRWQTFSGKSAIHAVSGKTFREIEEKIRG